MAQLPPTGNARRVQGIAADRDNMWEVLHRREGSISPRPRFDQHSPLRAAGEHAAGQRAGSVPARNIGMPPGEMPPRPPNAPNPPPQYEGSEWTPSNRYQRRHSVGWEMPKAAFPDPVEVHLNDPRYEVKAGLKNELRHKILNLEAASADAHGWLERRLESSQADQRADLARRWSNFEQGDRRFKEWVQREHEDLAGQMQQVKAASSESQQQNQRQATALATQCQRLELRLQEVESLVTQADAKANGLAHAVQVAGAVHVAGHASSNATSGAIQGALEALRIDLEREATARAQLAAESMEKIKELHSHISAVNERQEHEAYGRQQHLVEQSSRSHARVAALEPNFEALRSELDAVKEQTRRSGGDCMRRCEEVESACIQKVADVRESALRAAREAAEEQNSVLAECRASMASLQQILEAKDKIASQLQNLMQQQVQDDKEGLLQRLLQGDEALRSRLTEVETALAGEQSARVEGQHAAGAHANRMGVALEQAQASWIKEAERINAELRDIRRQADRAVDSEARGWERRLAEAVDSLQRRLDGVESKAHTTKATAGAVEDRLAELARAQENSIGEAEARLRRQVDDLQAMQAGKLSQCDFDLRAALRSGIAEQTERARAELARVEEGAAVERGLLRASLDDIGKEAEARFGRLREDFERRLAAVEEASTRRAVQASETASALRKQLTDGHNEARAYADRVAQDARTVADIALANFMEDMARETAKADRTVSEIAREIATVEARLQDFILGVETKAASQIQDGLKLEREKTQQEVERLFDEERSNRMQAEAERLASLQKRLQAHEDLTTRRLEDLKARQDDVFATHRQTIDAMMVQDKTETLSKIEELGREHKANSAVVMAELEKHGSAHDKQSADLAQGLDNVSIAAEEGRSKLEDRLQRELAAFHAKLTVAMSTASTELRQGLKGADDKLAAGLEATRVAAESSNKVLQELVEAKIETVGAALAAHALESAAARSSIRTDMEKQKNELENKIEECETTTEARDMALDTRITGLEQCFSDIRNDIANQGGDLASKITELMESAESRRSAFDERFQDVSTQMKAQEAETKHRVEEIEAGLKALDERIVGELNAEQDSRLSLVQRVDEFDDALKEENERAGSAEAELQKRLDELQKQSVEGDAELGKQVEELSEQLEALRNDQDGALGAELRRATAAETEILEKMEMQKAEILDECKGELQAQVQTARSEQEAVINASASNEALQDILQNIDEIELNQKKTKDELMGKLETMASKEDVDQLKAHQEQADGEVSNLKKEVEELQERSKVVENLEAQVKANALSLTDMVQKQDAVIASEVAGKENVSKVEAEGLQQLREDYNAFKTSVEAESKNTTDALAQETQNVQKLRVDVDAIQSAQQKTGEEREKTVTGFEEKLGSMVQSVADVMSKLDSKAAKEDVNQVKVRVEGGFDAIVVQLEAERWMRTQVDSVADGISQSFMQLLDQTSEKLAKRVHKVEQALIKTLASPRASPTPSRQPSRERGFVEPGRDGPRPLNDDP